MKCCNRPLWKLSCNRYETIFIFLFCLVPRLELVLVSSEDFARSLWTLGKELFDEYVIDIWCSLYGLFLVFLVRLHFLALSLADIFDIYNFWTAWKLEVIIYLYQVLPEFNMYFAEVQFQSHYEHVIIYIYIEKRSSRHTDFSSKKIKVCSSVVEMM